MCRLIIGFARAALLTGCSLRASEAPLEYVDKAAGLFFQRLNEADYEAIYDDASTRFKEKKTRDEIVNSLKELTQNGKVTHFARISSTIEGEGKDRIVGPVYATTFERNGGNLTLHFIDQGGEWRLIGFLLKLRG